MINQFNNIGGNFKTRFSQNISKGVIIKQDFKLPEFRITYTNIRQPIDYKNQHACLTVVDQNLNDFVYGYTQGEGIVITPPEYTYYDINRPPAIATISKDNMGTIYVAEMEDGAQYKVVRGYYTTAGGNSHLFVFPDMVYTTFRYVNNIVVDCGQDINSFSYTQYNLNRYPSGYNAILSYVSSVRNDELQKLYMYGSIIASFDENETQPYTETNNGEGYAAYSGVPSTYHDYLKSVNVYKGDNIYIIILDKDKNFVNSKAWKVGEDIYF